MPIIKNLVFQGGSVKGVAYPEATKALGAFIDLSKVERVAGTSAGSIFALLLALNFDDVTIAKLMSEFDFKAVLDDPEGGIPTSGKVLKSVEKAEQGQSPFFSKISAKTVKGPLVYRLGKQFGIYAGEFLRHWCEEKISEQVKKVTGQTVEHLTFAELHALVEKHPGKFRDLFVVGVNLNLGKAQVFSHDNPDTANVIIADAVRISMSIPFLFQPHHVHYKIDGKRLVDAQRHLWVDGGVYNNYPIRCFDQPRYLNEQQLGKQEDNNVLVYNEETLGFRLLSKEQKDYFEGLSEAPETQLENIGAFAKALMGAYSAKQNDDHDNTPADKQRTIYINHLGISMLAFNLSKAQQQALAQSGRYAVEMHFSGKSSVPLPKVEPDTAPEAIPAETKQRCVMQ